MAIVFIPSLQHMIMVKLITRACEHPDMFPFMYSDRNEDNLEQFCNNDRGMTLLPPILKTIMFLMLKCLRSEIKFWRDRYRKVLCFGTVENFTEFSWRFDGSIDSLETAKAFVRNENMPFCCRFYLGFCHFLENYVLDLWERTPENRKFTLVHSYSLLSLGVTAVYFLPWIISGASAEYLAHRYRPNNVTDQIFFSQLWKAEVSLRCLVERLPMDMRIDWLKRIARERYMDRDLAHFVVSGSVRNQGIAVFSENAFSALNSFLTWPLQIMFLDVAEHLWNYLDEVNFFELLNNISNKIDKTDSLYSELFKSLWRKRPQSYEEYAKERLRSPGDQFKDLISTFRDLLESSYVEAFLN